MPPINNDRKKKNKRDVLFLNSFSHDIRIYDSYIQIHGVSLNITLNYVIIIYTEKCFHGHLLNGAYIGVISFFFFYRWMRDI